MSLGDRRDGFRVRDVHGANNILIDFKPNRCDSSVYMNAKIDVTEFVKYIDKLKIEHPEVTYFHGMACIMAKTLYSRPLMNRFVANRTLYMHKDVSLSFVAKAEFNDESVEYLTVLKVKEDDTLLDIASEIKEKVNRIRSNKNDGGANDVVDVVGHLPKFLRVPIVGFLKWMDKHGWLPKMVTDGNIYYASGILSNIGVFDVGAIYHNLTNFGTASSLITFGAIREENGRKYMEMGATIDERIADGFYFCKALKLIEYMFSNPKLMMEPAGKHVSMPIKKDK